MAVATSAVRATVQALRQQGQLCAATGRATFRTSAVPRGGDHAPDYVHAKHMYDIQSVRPSFSLVCVCVCVCVCVRPGGRERGAVKDMRIRGRRIVLPPRTVRVHGRFSSCTIDDRRCRNGR